MTKKQFLVLIVLIFIMLCLTACSSMHSMTCKRWMNEGDFFSTMDSCKKCVATMGSGNKEAVKGCAMGLDASSLMR